MRSFEFWLKACYVLSVARARGQELCESGGGRPRLPVPNKPTVSVDVKQHFNNHLIVKAQELCESGGGRSGLPVPDSPCLCGCTTTLNFNLSPPPHSSPPPPQPPHAPYFRLASPFSFLHPPRTSEFSLVWTARVLSPLLLPPPPPPSPPSLKASFVKYSRALIIIYSRDFPLLMF